MQIVRFRAAPTIPNVLNINIECLPCRQSSVDVISSLILTMKMQVNLRVRIKVVLRNLYVRGSCGIFNVLSRNCTSLRPDLWTYDVVGMAQVFTKKKQNQKI